MSYFPAKQGAVVRCKAGGPRMLVVDYADPPKGAKNWRLVCAFETDRGEIQEAAHLPDDLELVARPPAKDWDLFA